VRGSREGSTEGGHEDGTEVIAESERIPQSPRRQSAACRLCAGQPLDTRFVMRVQICHFCACSGLGSRASYAADVRRVSSMRSTKVVKPRLSPDALHGRSRGDIQRMRYVLTGLAISQTAAVTVAACRRWML
jgi:hypothetical protein